MPSQTRPDLGIVDGLVQLSFLVQETLARRAGEHDLSLVQTRLLGALRDRRPTMNEIAALLGLDKSSASGLVDRAERRGLVRRRASASDGRSVQVALTRKGRTLAATVARDVASDVTTLAQAIDAADRAKLAALASRVVVSHAERHGISLFDTGSSQA